ncbi:GroES-like protein [Sanghuangporus baumii]|uniref:GroES-like protein n=1 Tax=Sanghuangporus baumii TaxID=108892 RepID=A0A9Q5HVZ6_SANBA|nr:GroES-like protein [Sanghuangporus baumii]
MQAAVYVPGNPSLKIDNHFEIPKPGPKQVLLKIQASGVCHTDVFLLSTAPSDGRTYIMGHEATGIAVEFGKDVYTVQKNKRYAAAVYVPGNPSLKIDNHFEIPKPGPKQVLLKIQASGICHTDVFLLSTAPSDGRTYIMGHEATGIAVEFGKDVYTVQKNKRYAITPGESALEEFFAIPSFGLGRNGGHAEYAVVDADMLVPVPENVPPEHAAVMADAGITVWSALKTTAEVKCLSLLSIRDAHDSPLSEKIKKGERVLITGIGGLGLLAVQLAVYLGAEVYAVDIRPSSRELALRFGARNAFDLVELDAVLAKGFQVDCAVDFVSTDTTFQKEVSAVGGNFLNSALQKRGRIVIVGASDHNLVTNALAGIVMGLQVRYSAYGVKEDLIEVLDLASKGIVRPIVDKLPLHEANKAYNDLRANLILSRRVLIPPAFWEESVYPN